MVVDGLVHDAERVELVAHPRGLLSQQRCELPAERLVVARPFRDEVAGVHIDQGVDTGGMGGVEIIDRDVEQLMLDDQASQDLGELLVHGVLVGDHAHDRASAHRADDMAQQVFGRPPDVVLRKQAQAGAPSTSMRVWLAPIRFEGRSVYLVQAGRPVGGGEVLQADDHGVRMLRIPQDTNVIVSEKTFIAGVNGMALPVTSPIQFPSVTLPPSGTYTSLGDVSRSGGTVSQQATESFEKAVALYEKEGSAALPQVQNLLEKAVSEDKNFGKAWFNLGVLAEKQGNLEKAREHYNKAVGVAPGLGAPLVNLGMLAIDSGDRAAGRDYFQRAVEADRFNPVAHNNISVFLREQGDFAEAVKHARLSLAGNAENLDAYANLARIYYRRGNFDVALLVCLNALKIDEKKADIHNIVGLVWLAKKDVTEAIRNFKRALEHDPNHVAAHMNLGAIVLNVRDYEAAIGHFEKVLSLQPENNEAKVSVAVAKRGLGDLAAANAIYAEVKAKDPKNALVEFNLGVLEHEHSSWRRIGVEPRHGRVALVQADADRELAGAHDLHLPRRKLLYRANGQLSHA